MPPEKSNAFEKETIDLFVRIFSNYGLDLASAKLFAMLYVEPEEISMDDLAEHSGYSLSGVSTKMKFMESLGLAERIKKPGTKKVYFYMNKSLKDLMIAKMKRALEIEIRPTIQAIPLLLDKYKKEYLSTKNVRLKKQYENLKKYYEDMVKLEKISLKLIEDVNEM